MSSSRPIFAPRQHLRSIFGSRLFSGNDELNTARLTGDVIGAHDLNAAYALRKEVELVIPEQSVILTTIISDAVCNSPGWYWLRDLELATVVRAALERAARGAPYVQTRAVRFLLDAGSPPYDPHSREQLVEILQGENTDARAGAIDYIVELNDLTFLPLLEQLQKESSGIIRDRALEY